MHPNGSLQSSRWRRAVLLLVAWWLHGTTATLAADVVADADLDTIIAANPEASNVKSVDAVPIDPGNVSVSTVSLPGGDADGHISIIASTTIEPSNSDDGNPEETSSSDDFDYYFGDSLGIDTSSAAASVTPSHSVLVESTKLNPSESVSPSMLPNVFTSASADTELPTMATSSNTVIFIAVIGVLVAIIGVVLLVVVALFFHRYYIRYERNDQ